VSKGLTPRATDKLVVMPGGGEAKAGTATRAPLLPCGEGRGGGRAAQAPNVKAFSGAGPRAEVSGTAALKTEPDQRLSPAEQLEQHALPFARSDARTDARAAAAEKRAEAKAKGYEGEACGECGNFTLVRNGTCLKCDTCGSTTGCS